jgi:hypothetical protein
LTSSSRPGPARSPYEWMKKPAYQSPNSSADPNGRANLVILFNMHAR